LALQVSRVPFRHRHKALKGDLARPCAVAQTLGKPRINLTTALANVLPMGQSIPLHFQAPH
ncbi:MAG: hypothetical protein KBG84_16890, partial [Planctomycetes bacterium]|nr:hypothetical protein [Planctomycetota bacterium]